MSAAFCPCRYRGETRTAKASDIFETRARVAGRSINRMRLTTKNRQSA